MTYPGGVYIGDPPYGYPYGYWYPQYYYWPTTTVTNNNKCPSTYRVESKSYRKGVVGIQCKYTVNHAGKHCAHVDYDTGEVFWTDLEANLQEIEDK